MAITLLSTVTTKAIASAGASSWNGGHTTDVGTTFLLLSVIQSPTVFTLPSTINWNGVAMSQLGTLSSGSIRATMYGLANPSIGTLTLTLTMSAGTRGGWVLRNYSGVDTSTPTGTAVTNSGTSTTPSVTVSSAGGQLVADIFGCINGDTTTVSSVGTGQSEDVANFIGSAGAGANSARIGVSREAGAASVVMDWTLSASRAWASIGVPLLPAPSSWGPSLSDQLNRLVLA